MINMTPSLYFEGRASRRKRERRLAQGRTGGKQQAQPKDRLVINQRPDQILSSQRQKRGSLEKRVIKEFDDLRERQRIERKNKLTAALSEIRSKDYGLGIKGKDVIDVLYAMMKQNEPKYQKRLATKRKEQETLPAKLKIWKDSNWEPSRKQYNLENIIDRYFINDFGKMNEQERGAVRKAVMAVVEDLKNKNLIDREESPAYIGGRRISLALSGEIFDIMVAAESELAKKPAPPPPPKVKKSTQAKNFLAQSPLIGKILHNKG